MRNRPYRRVSQVLAVATAACLAGAIAGSVGGAAAANVSLDLCATTGSATMPDGAVVPIWGFVLKPPAGTCGDVHNTATLPGPLLSVSEGDAVTLNVTNDLPAGHRIALEAPGIAFDPGPTEADVGATLSRSFVASAAGSYLYQSAGDAERQTAMGLYGALVVRPATANQAYDTAASAYDVEAPLVLSDVDPAFNADPDHFDMRDYRASYWLIGGKAYPDTAAIHAAETQRVLLRYVNAGHDNTTMMLLGAREHVLARDANLLPNAFDAEAETIPAGATEDAIVTVPAGSSGLTNGLALYNRQLHLGNGAPADPTQPGGMLTFIKSP